MEDAIYNLLKEHMELNPNIKLEDLKDKIQNELPLFELDVDLVSFADLAYSIINTSNQINALGEEISHLKRYYSARSGNKN